MPNASYTEPLATRRKENSYDKTVQTWMNLFCFFSLPQKEKPNAHCTHLQIAQADPQPKFAKECNLSIARKKNDICLL